ncbi:4-(cytidine 5'-diphospho)-2-C-methyl-D-erythritol kinase [Anaerococcus sp. Marseille-P9784]|uniref:4-(cytidine 5'-diphospho)-2-C-methyl-D-erythritol kinase n=1 Tax=Anaerococcus sp. Marseille-P9784 TaxID=2614127 RepID=UPI00124A5041|nr:4-(cytidine 5'-diphospho)-2-C-methyl-D-erythritol kinase [Anaerococcus sp. Marseille-P9784]
MIRKCYAKINLTLDSLYKRDDGYHEIDSIMTKINIFDELLISKNSTGEFNYSSNIENICPLEENLIYKVWDLLKDRTDNPGIDLMLSKNIPIAAGLAGGSTDAAEMIKALDELWDLNLSLDFKKELAKKLGADISFFLTKSPARARGIGEIISPFTNNLQMKALIINDGTKISSKDIYKNISDYGIIDNDNIVKRLEEGDEKVIKEFKNVMEDEVFRLFPHLSEIKNELGNYGALNALVSGSGASIFGIFTDDMKLNNAYLKLKDKYDFVEKVEFIND